MVVPDFSWPAFCNYIPAFNPFPIFPGYQHQHKFVNSGAMSDFEFLSVEFEFEGATYHALIQKKKKINSIEYHITVMNGKLEKLLYGNHIIKQVNGALQSDSLPEDKKVSHLKQNIMKALQDYLSAAPAQTVLPPL